MFTFENKNYDNLTHAEICEMLLDAHNRPESNNPVMDEFLNDKRVGEYEINDMSPDCSLVISKLLYIPGSCMGYVDTMFDLHGAYVGQDINEGDEHYYTDEGVCFECKTIE